MKRTAVCMFLVVVLAALLPVSGASAAPSRSAASRFEAYGGEAPTWPGAHALGCLPSGLKGVKAHRSAYGAGSVPLKSSIDLTSKLPPIGDQGAQGSCVGWSTGYYTKTWWEKREHPGWDLENERYRFSPSFIYNQINAGYDSGAYVGDALELLNNTGDVDISEFPYTDADCTTQPASAEKEAAKQYRIPDGYGAFFVNDPSWDTGPYDTDISDVKAYLQDGRPLVMAIPIFDDWPDFTPWYGKPHNPADSYYISDYDEANLPDWNSVGNGGNFCGGHAVCIAGYDDNANPGGGTAETRGGFLLVNSWGPSWNGTGRVYLSYRFVRQWVWEAWYMSDLDSSPRISTVSPDGGQWGDLVTVTGSNFGTKRRSARVCFPGGVNGDVVSWKNNQVKVRVPNGAVAGNILVADWNGEKSNSKEFGAEEGLGTGLLLAEGATWPGFDEWVLVQNPNSGASDVGLTFMTPAGTVAGPRVNVPANSRFTFHVNEYVPNQDVSTMVSVYNAVPVFAERAMYVNTTDGKWGAHDSAAATSPEQKWYLTEGATWPGYDEWIQVMNPNSTPVDAAVTFQTPEGRVDGPRLQLAPGTRGTIHVNEVLPNRDVSATVECLTSDRGIVVERSTYVATPDGKRGCHNSMGITELSGGWGLAEGATWPGFEEWLLVQNPMNERVDVYVYFATPDGVYEGPSGYMDPGSRVSLLVNDFMPGCDVSTMVFTGNEEQYVSVERAMYIATGDGKRGAHSSPGSVYASRAWYLPEGCTSDGFDEWILVMNPDTENPATVTVTFMTKDGPVDGPRLTVGPCQRETVHVNSHLRGDVSARVSSSDGYVVAERAMYIAAPDGKGGAHDALGVLSENEESSYEGTAPGRIEISSFQRESGNTPAGRL